MKSADDHRRRRDRRPHRALCLHRRGIDVDVFEQADAVRELGVGFNILPPAVAVLAELGLLEDLDRAGSDALGWLPVSAHDGLQQESFDRAWRIATTHPRRGEHR